MARLASLVACALVVTACGAAATTIEDAVADTLGQPVTTDSSSTTSTSTTTSSTTTTTTVPVFTLAGTVTAAAGYPLPDAVVAVGDQSATTDASGAFLLIGVPAGTVTVTRPAWHGTEVEWPGGEVLGVTLEPRIVRAVRVSKYVARDAEAYEALLELIETTTVNSLVFDTKDESGLVQYDTNVGKAHELGAVGNTYDPIALIAAAQERGLYTITRVVSFEDDIWAAAEPEAKLAGDWVDARDERNWEYPIALGVEACELGFEEVQFDYVRFPAGTTGAALQQRGVTDEASRLSAIQGFLTEARSRIHPLGCAVSADIFGIVMSAPNDQGIGQRPEEVSASVDAVSPMIYPSHYSPGWLGFDDPNDHPAAVTAESLDSGAPRLQEPALLRPWLQAFYYNGSQVLAGINEAEERGMGWMLWNAPGNYSESWLPPKEAES